MKYLLHLAPAAFAAVFGFLVSAGGAPVDKPADRNPADAGPATGHALEGRIQNVDATKRELMLTDVRSSPAATSTDKPATPDRPGTTPSATPDRDRPAAAPNDRGTGTGTATGTGAGANAASMMVQVAENAKITLDGKPADLRDLKADMFARVYIRSGAEGAGTGTTTSPTASPDRDRPAASPPASTDRDRPATAASGDRGTGAGTRLMTDRIEVSTKRPSDAGKNGESRDK